MSDEQHPEDWRHGPRPVVLGVAAGMLVVLLAIGVAVFLRTGDEEPEAALTGSPVTPTTTPTETASPTPTPTPTRSPSETETQSREPTDADAAAFAQAYQLEGGEQVERVAVDVNGDGRKEVVVAGLVSGVSRVEVAAWNGHAYEVVFRGEGGRAEELADLSVTDYTGDATREIVTIERSGQQGESLSVYGWDGQVYVPQRAVGGCWDGSHTYGITGARISLGRITATCDEPNLPLAAQPSDVYTWSGRAWTFERSAG